MALSKDATIRTASTGIPKAIRFVAQLYQNMGDAADAHGPVVVRMGMTGKGSAPNHRFEPASGGPALIAIDGANHCEWEDGSKFHEPLNWSTATMTYPEVEELLREMTGFRGTAPKRH